ncbi:MAG: acyl-CoA thioesterase [Burkholderiales bacterium]|nr:acyl-CoA thioesterase [Burkholderiales bacterium]MDE2397223.1 acyl-CoA thioesterase [Burkholderiales bacterium]MDE2453395.1 acyl-CoA thioesterase [Burkholderiales bacterium]
MDATTYAVQVEWGDCGPGNVVLVQSFARWMDEAAQQHFRQRRAQIADHHADPIELVAMPPLELNMSFYGAAAHPEALEILTWVEEWREAAVVHRHRVLRGATVICEGRSLRAFHVVGPEIAPAPPPFPEWIRERIH